MVAEGLIVLRPLRAAFPRAEVQNFVRFASAHGPVRMIGILGQAGLRALICILRSGVERGRWRIGRRLRLPRTARVSSDAFSQVTGAGLVEDDDLEAIVQYARANLRGEVDRIIIRAEGILRGRFPLCGVERTFEGDPAWSGPVDDIEDLFYLNRWYHGVTLAKAFAYTGGEHFAMRFADLLENWGLRNPPRAGSPVWESYSVSERISNWLFSARLLERSSTHARRIAPALEDQLAKHARFLAHNLEDRVIHNHLINNARALFAYGVLRPNHPRAGFYRSLGWRILRRELPRQTNSDGMLAEQSTHYHLLLLSRFAEVALLAERNGIHLSDEYRDRLRLMFATAAAFVRPDRTLALIGDVSPDIDPQALVGVAAISGLWHMPACVPPNEYALWFLGRRGLEAFERSDVVLGALHLDQSGYAALRTPHLHAVMRCDPKARVVRHGHHDALGLDLWLDGWHLLIDTGNSSFRGDPWESYFRGPRAHSVPIVDGVPLEMGSHLLSDVLPRAYTTGSGRITRAAVEGNAGLIEAEHSGYARLTDPVNVTRRVRVDPAGVEIEDRFTGRGRHDIEILFQFGSAGASVDDSGRRVLLEGPSGRKAAFAVDSSGGDCGIAILRADSPGGWWSPAYGLRVEGTTVAVRMTMERTAAVRSRIHAPLGLRASEPVRS